jgi:hypothetical protein
MGNTTYPLGTGVPFSILEMPMNFRMSLRRRIKNKRPKAFIVNGDWLFFVKNKYAVKIYSKQRDPQRKRHGAKSRSYSF